MIDKEEERKVHRVGSTSWAKPKRWLVIMNLEAKVMLVEESMRESLGKIKGWEMWIGALE